MTTVGKIEEYPIPVTRIYSHLLQFSPSGLGGKAIADVSLDSTLVGVYSIFEQPCASLFTLNDI